MNRACVIRNKGPFQRIVLKLTHWLQSGFVVKQVKEICTTETNQSQQFWL